MRLSRSAALWLAAALSVGTARGQDTITFLNSTSGDPSSGFPSLAIFYPTIDGGSIPMIRTFPWTVSPFKVPTLIKEVHLVVNGDVVGTVTRTPTKASAKGFGSLYKSGTQMMGGRDAVDDSQAATSPITITMTSAEKDGSVTINDMVGLLNLHAGAEMYFELLWDTDTGGKSYSRAFTVAQRSQLGDLSTNVYTNQNPFKPEESGNDPNGSGGMSTSSSSSTASATSATTSVATGQSFPPTTTAKPSTSSPATTSTGLATGAKIGIGVGVSLGALLLLGALAFFLLKRRRRSTRHDSAYLNSGHGGHHTPELIAQKEANAGVSPHSPYSDDGRTPLPAHPPAMSQTYDRASLDAPGSVRDGRDSVSVRGLDASGRGSRGGAVSHLVEEGMTEAEIQRLEEEERELDQAIEQAGAGRGR